MMGEMNIPLIIFTFVSILSLSEQQPTKCEPCTCFHNNLTLTITCSGVGPKDIEWDVIPRLNSKIELLNIQNFEFNHIPVNWRILISAMEIKNSLILDMDLSVFKKIDSFIVDNSKILNSKSIHIPASIKHLAVTNSGLSCFKIPYEHNLNILDLSGNNLTEIPISKNLQQLILSRNKLLGLIFSTNDAANHLQHLDLSSNFITDLPELPFKNVIPQGNHQKLTLNIANNEIRSIHARAFAGIQIQRIRMDHNKLQAIDKSLLDWDKVEYIDLQHNPWDCECSAQWMLDMLLPKLYEKQSPKTIIDLRCCLPNKFKGMQFAYWLNRTHDVFCGAEYYRYDGSVLVAPKQEIFWTWGMITGIVLSCLLVFLLIILITVYLCRRRKSEKKCDNKKDIYCSIKSLDKQSEDYSFYNVNMAVESLTFAPAKKECEKEHTEPQLIISTPMP